MDLTAEYYLQTVDVVFVRHALPKGEMTHRGKPVDPSKIRRVALMTVEGENDDISGLGQTEATHASVPEYSRSSPRALRVKRALATTACSTDRDSVPKSCRASPISCCRRPNPKRRQLAEYQAQDWSVHAAE